MPEWLLAVLLVVGVLFIISIWMSASENKDRWHAFELLKRDEGFTEVFGQGQYAGFGIAISSNSNSILIIQSLGLSDRIDPSEIDSVELRVNGRIIEQFAPDPDIDQRAQIGGKLAVCGGKLFRAGIDQSIDEGTISSIIIMIWERKRNAAHQIEFLMQRSEDDLPIEDDDLLRELTEAYRAFNEILELVEVCAQSNSSVRAAITPSAAPAIW